MPPDAVAKILAVVGTGALELWWAVPLGLALGLHPVLAAAASALGAILSAAAVVLIGGPIRRWAIRRVGTGGTGRTGRARRVWDRYGMVGLGLSSPILTGAPLGAALSVALGVPAPRLLAWMSIGIVAWSALLTVAGALGWAGLGHHF